MKKIGDETASGFSASDYDINVIFKDLPIPEMVTKNSDDSYTIFINARLSQTEQNKMFVHAVKHITGRDFEKHDVQIIEQQNVL